MKAMKYNTALWLIFGLAACGGDRPVDTSCDEPKRYQAVTPGKRISVPEGLDPLNEFAEMPIPAAQNARERPEGARCIESPPSINLSRQ